MSPDRCLAAIRETVDVADKRSQVLNFIYWEARKHRRTCLYGPSKRVNQKQVCLAMGIDEGNFSRLVDGRQKPGESIYEGLKRWTGIDSDGELHTAIEEAPMAPSGAYRSNYP